MIPKIIHYIFYPFYFDEMPQQWKKNIEKWMELHPDYQHIIWDLSKSKDFLRENYPNFLDIWLAYKYPIQKCDSIRYFILYHYGGIYSDLDLVALKPIDNLLHFEMLIPESSVGGGVSNSFLGAIPKHQFFKMAINELPNSVNKFSIFGKHLNVMYSTGPAFLDGIMKLYPNNDFFVICKKMYYGDCNACSDTSRQMCSGALFGHTSGKSWNKWDTKLLNHLYCHWREYLIAILTIIIFTLVYYIYYKNCRIGLICHN